MKKYFNTVLSITLFCLSVNADIDCTGGEGGSPFINISKEFKTSTKLVKTPNLIKDFFIRENTNALIYKSEDDFVFYAKAREQTPITFMKDSFSRVLDPWDSLIVAKNLPWAFNIYTKTGVRIGNKENRGKDLYWEGSRLFSVDRPITNNQIISYSISYLNDNTQSLSCRLFMGSDVEIRIANSGHTFPYLLLYTTKELKEGTQVVKYKLRLEAKKKFLGEIPRCELTEISAYKNLMPGKIKGLYHFGDLEETENSAWLLDIEHPAKRLLWSYYEQCTYYNAPESAILLPNPEVPVVAMQKDSGGITLLYPMLNKSVDLLENLVKKPIATENLWLTSDKKNLYVAAQPENENARALFKVSLDQVQ